MKLKTLSFIILLSAFSIFSKAEESTYIKVGTAKVKKIRLSLPSFTSDPGSKAGADKSYEILKKDLNFVDSFELIQEAKDKTGADYILKTITVKNEKGFVAEALLTDLNSGTSVLSKRYIAALTDVNSLSHTMANDIVKTITGESGIFETKIAAICDRTGKKELVVMDFDGSNPRQITHHNSIVSSPAWSPDGSRIVYSLIAKNKKNIKNTNLYEFDFKTSTIKILSDRQGLNSGAHFHPDGKHLALTMSFLGNSEIFSLDPTTKSVTRLTNNPAIDVDPNWSPDGKYISFVSSRSGNSMVYKMNADGSNVQRLTFAGSFNATPAWSPKNNKIAFAGWLDGRFDIFTMNTDGTTIERLTKNNGNNEDPAFSGDGNLIVFSSNRAGSKNIYVMDINGSGVKRLTYGLGNCISPRWSLPVK